MRASAASLSATHSPAKPLRRLRAGIAAFSILLIAGYSFDSYQHVQSARQDITTGAVEQAETLLLTLDEHLARTVQAAGLVLDTAVERVEKALLDPTLDTQAIGGTLQDLLSRAPQLVNLGLIDASGRVISDTFSSAVGLDLSPRRYFQTHASTPSAQILLSPAVASRATGRVFMPLSRRADRPDGSFAGVIYGGLEPEYLENFYSRLQGRQVVVLSLYSSDGILVARIPRRAGMVGQDMRADPLFTQLLPQAPSGSARLPADDFGPTRHIAYRQAPDMPYVIAASMSEDMVLSTWREQAIDSAQQTFFVALTITGLAGLLIGTTYRREKVDRELVASEARFRDFAEAASDWYWEMGPDLRFTRIFGRTLAGDNLVGKRREDLFDLHDVPMGLHAHLDDLASRRPFRDFRYHCVLPNGIARYCTTSGKPIFAEDGTFLGYRGTGRDITSEIMAEQRAEQAHALLSGALEQIAEGFVLFDAEDRLVMWNSRYQHIHEHTADLMVAGRRFEDVIRMAAERGSVPAALGRVEEWIAERLASHRAARGVHEQQFADGRWLRIEETCLSDGGRVGIHTDITEIKRREDELRELAQKNSLFAAAIATTTSGIIITHHTRLDRPIVYVNRAFTEMTGYSAEEAIGRQTRFLRAPETDPAGIQEVEAAWREQRAGSARILNRRKDGSTFYTDLRISPVRDAANRVTHFVGVLNDVSAQVAAEEKLRQSEEHIRSIAENQPGVTMQRVQKPDGSFHYTYLSERTVELSGYTAREFCADPELIWRLVHPEDAPAYKSALAQSARDLQPADLQYRLIHREGTTRWLRGMFRPRREADGTIIWDGTVFDVTDRVKADELIRENQARLRSIADNLPGVVYQRVLRADGTISYPYVSPRALELTGYSAEEIIADPSLLPRIIAPEFHAGYGEVIARSAREMAPAQFEFRLVRRDGQSRWARGLCQPRPLTNGDIVWDGLIFDITQQKRTEEHRQELENQLRHAQKIEALGTLAGGIAHDINNTLVPIVALGKLTLQTLPADSSHRESMKTILDAAHRIRDLVTEILAFSRKEMPKTERVSLPDTITKAVRLLSAVLTPNVTLVQKVESACVVDADDNQLVQVLMNLCTNAAHAIGRNHGQVTIALDEIIITEPAGIDGARIAPGPYAQLTVADTGCGMDALILQRIFEPFFTTKGVGEGTGLGLSVVHGIIANHHGRITVGSEPGRGTTVTIQLPLAVGADIGSLDTPKRAYA